MSTTETDMGQHARMAKPRVRETPTIRFIRSIPDTAATAAVSDSLGGNDSGIPRATPANIFRYMTESVHREGATRYIPRWFNGNGLCDMVSAISADEVWQKLLNQSPHRIKREALEESNVSSVNEAASKIEEQNSKFKTRAILNVVLGAVVGDRINKVLNHTTPYLKDGKILPGPTIAYDVALEVGRRFGTPAAGPEELLERVQSLVPNPDTKSSDGDTDLVGLFVRYHTFDNPGKDETRRCPAIHLTRVMLDEWGRQLATPSYRQRFLAAVQR